MFRQTPKDKQIDLFCGAAANLEGKSYQQYTSEKGWHNQFYKQVVSHIDESIFKVLYSEKMGAPNAPVTLLVGMMILKEAYGWSDSQLFENCRYNLLVRAALGLQNLNDPIPTESTYYLFRQHVHQYSRDHGDNLFEKAFESVTRKQVEEFNVSGDKVRMDSKLFGSNIAWYSRYEIIHQTLTLFCKKINKSDYKLLSEQDKQQMKDFLEEESNKTVYRSTRKDIQSRLKNIGIWTYKLLRLFSDNTSESYKLLKRVFEEQYEVEKQKVTLRAKEKISSDSVQSPHDPDSSYRHKSDQKVKGYSMNITETLSDDSLNLITNIQVDKANLPDTAFVEPAIRSTNEVIEGSVKKVYADGAYQSPDNDEFCKDIDMVFTGMQGAVSRYDLEMTPEGLWVTDAKTGECMLARLAKKFKNSKEDRWVIRQGKDTVYFSQQAIRASTLRRKMKQRPIEELQKRNNVEATVFHMSCLLRNSKSKYRGLINNQIWALCRAFWVNLTRIIYFLEKTLKKSRQKWKPGAFIIIFQTIFELYKTVKRIFKQNASDFAFWIALCIFSRNFKTYFLE